MQDARIHHAKLLQPFLKEHENSLELMFLPPYSPNLNLIEGLWKWIKEKVGYNGFFEDSYRYQKKCELIFGSHKC